MLGSLKGFKTGGILKELDVCWSLVGQVFGRSVGPGRRFFWGASNKLGVECECRRGLKVYLGGHGGSLGPLRVNLDAIMGQRMAKVLVFWGFFWISGAFLKGLWGPLGQEIVQDGMFKGAIFEIIEYLQNILLLI